MAKNRYGAEAIPEKRAVPSGRHGGRTTNEVTMAPSIPERANPHNLPEELLSAADSSITDVLEIVIHYIDGLPGELKNVLADEIEPALLDILRSATTGLQKIRLDAFPTEQELSAIIHSAYMARELASGLDSVMTFAAATPELQGFVDEHIVKQLETAAVNVLPASRHHSLVTWLERVQDDPAGPFLRPPDLRP